MKREIKFRGLDENGNWVFSNGMMKFQDGTVIMILSEKYGVVSTTPVKPESVGQFTGMIDKNGVDVYEGDILSRVIGFGDSSRLFTEKVVFDGCSFCTIDISDDNKNPDFLAVYLGHTIEVIGNIHQ